MPKFYIQHIVKHFCPTLSNDDENVTYLHIYIIFFWTIGQNSCNWCKILCVLFVRYIEIWNDVYHGLNWPSFNSGARKDTESCLLCYIVYYGPWISQNNLTCWFKNDLRSTISPVFRIQFVEHSFSNGVVVYKWYLFVCLLRGRSQRIIPSSCVS